MVYIDCCTLFMKNPTVNDKVNIGFIGVSEDGEHQRESVRRAFQADNTASIMTCLLQGKQKKKNSQPLENRE